MKEEIVNAYLKLRQHLLDNDYKNLNVIIICSPNAYDKLRKDTKCFMWKDINNECDFVSLCGKKTPLIIDFSMGDNIEFRIMQEKDYERIEQEKLIMKLNRMFCE